MQSIARQPKEDPRPEPLRFNRSKSTSYGEIHLIHGIGSTVIDLHTDNDGSGKFKVVRNGVEVAYVEWPAEKFMGVTDRERETL
jgi:hypothetical protein